MKCKNRFLAILLSAVMLVSVIPLHALALPADKLIYPVGDISDNAYLLINRFTGALENAVNLSGDLVIPSTVEGVAVTSIADGTFYGSENVVSVTVPSSVTKIGDRAFGACTSLKSVKLEEGVASLGKDAFRYCYALTDVSLPSTLTAIEDYTFAACLALQSIKLPSGVTRVGSYAFEKCGKLTSVTLPGNISEIGEYAFSSCTSLQSLTLPQSLQAIPTALFNDCTSLQNVVVPASVKSIGKSAFGGCSSLEELILPEGVEKIYDWAFNGCKLLTSLSMPDSIRSIAADAFYGCDDVTFHVNAGSYSQVFASANKIPFVLGTLKPDDPDDPEYPETPFTDVKNHWAKTYIEWAYAKGYFNGTSPTKFSPNASVNRGMLVSVLYRMDGEPAVGKSSFTDVPAKAYYADAVAWGEKTKVVTGMGGGKFMPARNITREQLATMLYRYAQYKNRNTSTRADLTEYKDASKVSSFAGAAMSWAVGSGIITGRSGAMLDPSGNASRAEAAAMLQRFDSLK